MIEHKKILTGLMTAALILSSHSAVTGSVYASEQQETEDSTAAETASVTNAEATSEAEKKTEVNSEAEAEKNTETTVEVTSETNSEAASDTGSETNSESASDKNSEIPSENGSEKNTEITSENGSDKNSEAADESEAEKNSETNSDKNSESTSESEAEKNSETTSESETEKNTETTTETEAEENTKTTTGTEVEESTETETDSATATEETETADVLSEEDPDSSVPADVFKVILPTIPEDDTTFDYILDPQGLIELTDAKKYGGTDEVAFEHDKTLYFKTSKSDDGRPVYDNVSNALTVTNMSSREVQITVKATITSSEGITMSESSTFDADDTSPSIYLALTDGTNTIPITSEDAVINAVIDAPEDAYETVWDGEKNVYELTDAAKEDDYDGFQTYSFWLTGACNANADWSKVEGQIPEVCVVWEVE